MEAYLESIVKPILSKPESFRITKTIDDMGVLLTVDIDAADMGQLLGKEGQNISGIRRLVSLFGLKNKAKISIKINEPRGGKRYNHGTN